MSYTRNRSELSTFTVKVSLSYKKTICVRFYFQINQSQWQIHHIHIYLISIHIISYLYITDKTYIYIDIFHIYKHLCLTTICKYIYIQPQPALHHSYHSHLPRSWSWCLEDNCWSLGVWAPHTVGPVRDPRYFNGVTWVWALSPL